MDVGDSASCSILQHWSVIKDGTAAGTYLYVNDADAAFSATADVFVKLVGMVGSIGDVGSSGDFFG